jgi:hypothetical protein
VRSARTRFQIVLRHRLETLAVYVARRRLWNHARTQTSVLLVVLEARLVSTWLVVPEVVVAGVSDRLRRRLRAVALLLLLLLQTERLLSRSPLRREVGMCRRICAVLLVLELALVMVVMPRLARSLRPMTMPLLLAGGTCRRRCAIVKWDALGGRQG